LRDGRLDRSGAWSILATLVYRINALQSAALRYDYTYRKLRELRIPGLTSQQATSVLQAVFQSQSIIDSLTVPVRIGQVIFFTSLGHLDDIARPRHGFVLKPNLAVTVPPGLSNVQFGRADAQLTYFRPFPGRDNALMLRGSLGGLWPFGASIPGPGESPTLSWYRMRDEVLTAGGATDVRGYQSQLLGPKFPVIEPDVVSGDTVYHSDHYAALGGLRRFTASAELRLGMPWFGRDVFGHLFADAGRVWTSDSRFQFGGLLVSDEDRVFYTTGGGVGYYTPVGAIRFDLGYKLNPSTYDLRDPQRVVDALRSGLPPSAAPVNETRRIVVHLSLGLFF
ncbi:MAG TPA: BamA/TamA family outer membrane protein, partial [Candidatus Eisenbacteria bacterium]